MRMRHCQVSSFALLVALAAGCGDGGATGTVTGEVLYAGAPVEHGAIQFVPKDGKGVPAGGTVTAGKFTVTGVSVGTMVVTVTPTAESTGPISSADSAREAAERAASKKKFTPKPASFPADAGGNKVTCEVKPGANTFKMELTAPRPH